MFYLGRDRLKPCLGAHIPILLWRVMQAFFFLSVSPSSICNSTFEINEAERERVNSDLLIHFPNARSQEVIAVMELSSLSCVHCSQELHGQEGAVRSWSWRASLGTVTWASSLLASTPLPQILCITSNRNSVTLKIITSYALQPASQPLVCEMVFYCDTLVFFSNELVMLSKISVFFF